MDGGGEEKRLRFLDTYQLTIPDSIIYSNLLQSIHSGLYRNKQIAKIAQKWNPDVQLSVHLNKDVLNFVHI